MLNLKLIESLSDTLFVE